MIPGILFTLCSSGVGTIPSVSVKASHDGPYYTGTVLTLTCDIQLDSAIDIPVVESVQWVIGGMVLNNPLPNTDRVTFTNTTIDYFPLDVTDNATLRCDVQFKTENFHRQGKEFELTVEGNWRYNIVLQKKYVLS